jgi:hypothetical protein
LNAFYGFVKKLIEGFGRENLDYALTGALAASFYGVPRTTSDVDILIAIPQGTDVKDKVVKALEHAGLEIDLHKIDEALVSGYNILTLADKASPFTVDVIFSSEPIRKQGGTVAGVKTFFQSPEGLIIAKLRMIKATLPRERAAKDEEDIRAVLTFSKVNLREVKTQAEKDGTLTILDALVSQ